MQQPIFERWLEWCFRRRIDLRHASYHRLLNRLIHSPVFNRELRGVVRNYRGKTLQRYK